METQHLFMHGETLIVVINQIFAHLFTSLGTIGFQALHHIHFHCATFVVALMINQTAGQIGEGCLEIWCKRHCELKLEIG